MIDNISDGSMEKLFGECTESLKTKILELAKLKNEFAGLSRGIDKKKGDFLKEAYDVKDLDGKPLLKNQDLRDEYIAKKLGETDAFTIMTQQSANIKKLEAEITALDYEFHFRKTTMNFVAAKL
jgi:hypothetical protein